MSIFSRLALIFLLGATLYGCGNKRDLMLPEDAADAYSLQPQSTSFAVAGFQQAGLAHSE